ncbi:uncharacterized protein LOC143343591 isoform X2 [Colletes latitarsis]|uniref:uncharacterized protein LOC143343591 isoform X2 n=1 Tax=Colletes latitarsis TaxID=2605962 RepID=UPI0040358E18
MSRRAVLGRAALSFDTTDGVLDIDQIMETDPWKHIDDFVQQNFMQDILNQFDERMKLDPKPVPAEAKKPRKSPNNRSKRTNRENLSNETSSPMADNENSARNGGTLPKTRKQAFGLRGKRVNDTETKEKKRNSVPKRQRLVRRRGTATSKNSQQLENATKSSAGEDFTAKRSTKKRTGNENENENVADMSICKTECVNPMEIVTENAAIDGNVTSKHQTTIETLKNASSCSTFKTSTPERFVGAVSNNSTEPYEFPITKKPNVDQCKSLHKEHWKKETSAKCEYDTTVELKNCVEKREEEKVKKGSGQKNGKKRSSKSEKVSKHEKQIGKFEKRLLKKEKKRRDGQIYREERKAQRAIEKFSHHVTSIAEKMGYLQKRRSNSRANETNDSSDFSGESSYTSSSYDSSASCSCSCSCSSCSCTSCSCSYDLSDCSFSDNSYGTDEYSEYTLCSCSGCDTSCSSE